VTLETGKIVSEGLGEVQEMIDICDFAVGLSRQLYGRTIATERADHRMMETWHPLGVCGVISAFNFPVAVWSWNAALAFVCGDSVVWKPSEKTPLTTLATQAVVERAMRRFDNAPDGLSGIVIGGRDIGSEDDGTTVTNNPTGDGRTLGPIRAALGYYYADSLFLGPNNLIVEGVTDWWILESVSKYFIGAGKPGLPPGLALPPVDGAPKVPNMVSLLTSQKLNVLVLLDDENQARGVRDEMIKSRLVRDQQVILVSEAFDSGNRPSEADIEDLLDPIVFENLARDAYAKELEGKTLNPSTNIPRIVKRFEAAFIEIGLTFHKTRTAGLFYRRMGANPTGLMNAESLKRFETLFAIIKVRLEKITARGAEPFH
jgi:hypothetical protein